MQIVSSVRIHNVALRVGVALGQLAPPGTPAEDWPGGWCNAESPMDTQLALSLGVSMLLGVGAWVFMLVALLGVVTMLRQQQRMRAYMREPHGAATTAAEGSARHRSMGASHAAL